MDVNRLEQIAQQLVARVRDDEPETNLRWLRSELGADQNAPISDEERLVFVLAGVVPDDRKWSELTAWTRPSSVDTPVDMEKRRRMKRVA